MSALSLGLLFCICILLIILYRTYLAFVQYEVESSTAQEVSIGPKTILWIAIYRQK